MDHKLFHVILTDSILKKLFISREYSGFYGLQNMHISQPQTLFYMYNSQTAQFNSGAVLLFLTYIIGSTDKKLSLITRESSRQGCNPIFYQGTHNHQCTYLGKNVITLHKVLYLSCVRLSATVYFDSDLFSVGTDSFLSQQPWTLLGIH